MRVDSGLKVAHFVARQGAYRAKRLEVLFGAGHVALHEVSLADVLVRAAVARVDGQRAFVVLEGLVEPTQLSERVAELVVKVGSVGKALERIQEVRQRTWVVVGLQRGQPGAIFGVGDQCLLVALFGGGRARAPRKQREHGRDQPSTPTELHLAARYALACTISGKDVSASRVNSSSLP